MNDSFNVYKRVCKRDIDFIQQFNKQEVDIGLHF